ncbi:MAG TPA: nucleotidyltransferase family protein, partial [Sphingomicrobium sp.]
MWSPEFRLALQAGRHASGKLDSLPDYQEVDWDRFLVLVRRHRIQGLVFHALVQLQAPMPKRVAEQLARDADTIVSGNLHAASACKRIDRAFRDAGQPLLFIKGLTLASLAYSNPFLKMSWDIDVLVDPRSIEPASQILTGLGYRLVIPRGQVVQWHRHRKESVWQGPDGTTVELHGRL